MQKSDLWLIGCGNNAIEHFKVLNELDISTKVIGRSKNSGDFFYSKTSIKPLLDGLYNNLISYEPPHKAIVSVSIDQLFECTKLLIKKGCKKILIEKPGALKIGELVQLKQLKDKYDANLWIAYNRRFYQSVRLLKKLSEDDGGIKSLIFEFTEFSSSFENSKLTKEIIEKTLLCNSSHVIDLAFYLIGEPKKNKWSYFNSGHLLNHKSSSRFHGSGISENNIPFSYYADWECPGRWGVEVMTKKNRFILRPLEKLQVISKGTLDSKFVDFSSKVENNFKPGFYMQCKEFLSEDHINLKTIEEQINSFNIYNLMAAYS